MLDMAIVTLLNDDVMIAVVCVLVRVECCVLVCFGVCDSPHQLRLASLLVSFVAVVFCRRVPAVVDQTSVQTHTTQRSLQEKPGN